MCRASCRRARRVQKFRDVLSRWEARELSQLEAAALLGVSERQFRRYRDRWNEQGEEALLDRRLGKPSARAIAEDERERKPCAGMMLHQDASKHAWLAGQPPLDLVVTMDDATSTIYSAFLVEEDGTASTFQGLQEVFSAHGLPCQLYTDRGSHYFYTPEAGGKVDKTRLTQVGRALDKLGVEHIAAYSPEARGRSERMFGTLQDRMIKELALAGIDDIAAANAWIRDDYLPRHNARFAKPARLPDRAFAAVDDATLRETLAIEEERVVACDNTVSRRGSGARMSLQIPAGLERPPLHQSACEGARVSRWYARHLPRPALHRSVRAQWGASDERPDRLEPGRVLDRAKAKP